MGQPSRSRRGSMAYWPRVRAKKETPKVNSVIIPKEYKVEGFYGYKVGMTQVVLKDNYVNSMSKNQNIVKAVTIVECPPLKVAGVRFYKKVSNSLIPSSDVFSDKVDKELSRKMIVPKGKELNPDINSFDDLRLIVYTMPKVTSLPKKKPEVFELRINGTKEEKLAYAKEKFGKEINVSEVLKINELVDVHAVTKGKGYQGPVKRFGVDIRSHKAEKTKRGPASLGPWCAQGHIMYRVAHAGTTGYHLRTEYNKAIIHIDNDTKKVNPIDGFRGFGFIKNPYVLIMGSIPGPTKRMIRMIHAQRPNPKKITKDLKLIKILNDTKQGI